MRTIGTDAPVAGRHLIVNADDFGQSPGVNRGIIEAHQRGIVTSASLMVRWPYAAEAAAYGRAHPDFSLGLHFDFGEWCQRDETWTALYEVVPLDDAVAVSAEASRQLARFRALAGKDPTHLDSHQHDHRSEPVRSVLIEIAGTLGVSLRHCSPEISYCGNFYGQMADGSPHPNAISVDGLIETLAALPPGVTELGCHPGWGNDLDSMYVRERATEVEVLCDDRVRTAIVRAGIELRSFRGTRKSWPTSLQPGPAL